MSKERDRREAPLTREEIGRIGEEAVARELKRQGYAILERRYRCRYAEIDLVVARGQLLLAVEVKTRSQRWIARFGRPELGIHPRQIERLGRAISTHPAARKHRFLRVDLFAVVIAEGRVVELFHQRGIDET